jgi:nucleoside-diphosphate-sugar epimerase
MNGEETMKGETMSDDFRDLFSRGLDYKNFEGRTILIAGATSFIISYLADAFLFYNDNLAKRPIKLICIARNREKAENRFRKHLEREDFELIIQDITQPISIECEVDVIIHAASQASPKYYGSDPTGTFNSNVIGTYNLLEFARTKSTKDFLFLSSGEVYGQIDKPAVSEKDYGYIDCTDLRACYSEGKRAGETMCVCYAHQFGINAKIARLFHTYGPNMPEDDGRVYVDFLMNIRHCKDIVMKSDGSAVRTFTYVTDALDGFLRIILKGEPGQAYNVSNKSQTMSILDLAQRLVSEFSERQIKVVQTVRRTDPNYIPTQIKGNAPDTSKIEGLGFCPKITVEQGFRKLVR